MKEQSATPKFGEGLRRKYRHAAPASDVPSITNASAPHSEEMHQRMVKYAVAMGIRMVCLAAIFVFDGWFKLIPVIGAVILPWVAVVIANGGADIVHQEPVKLLDEAPMYAVDGGTEDADENGTGGILTGEIVGDEGNAPGVGQPSAGEGTAGQDNGSEDSGDETATQEDRHHEHL